MISYAQNFEDVMLWRALSHIDHGFYIDVGANDPTIDSVTRVFYENGWNGINIEPIESHFRDLQEHRPHDVNLKCAAGSRDGEIDLWECDVRGWATVDKHVVEQHTKDGHQGVFHKVPVIPLAKICGEFAHGPIHFLKVDVEGFEQDVLEGMDFTQFRPWIVLVEATRPNSRVEVHQEWEKLLVSARYTFAYADGLNRYYVAEERSDLLDSFRYPPNVFDEFVRIDVLQAEAQAQQAEQRESDAKTQAQQAEARAQQAAQRESDAKTQAQQAEARAQQAAQRESDAKEQAQQAESRAKQAEANAQQLGAQLYQKEQEANVWHERVVQLHESTSWRITKPLRVVKKILTGDPATQERLRNAATARVKRFVKPAVVGVMNFVLLRPALKARVSGLLRNRSPSLHARLRAMKGQALNHGAEVFSIGGIEPKTDSYLGKKVAVLAPGAADGTVGGAERFHEGLAEALRRMGCDVDLIYKVFDEASFETIKQGYHAFADLDLGGYDLVISTKAPTYVISHPNHVMYLQHTIRVFYDMFDVAFPDADKTLHEQRDWIHKTDTEAFKRIKARFSQAKEVTRRLQLWNDCDAEVLYPEIVVDGLYDQGIGDYFYMPGRLHAWKRVDLAIKAVKLSRLPLRLVISGTGEAEGALRELAGNDKRIEFLGRVDDEKLKKLYANALAVPFLPIREDYGYVTLEAFACGKAVITCMDSGEPVEFVVDGETGFVCSPDPQAICLAFEQLWNDRELAARMGKAGREKTAYIKWSGVVDNLLKAGFPDIKVHQQIKTAPLRVAVLDMQPIMPAVGGGRLRLLGLYHALGPDIQVRYVGTYDWPGEKYRRHAITPTLEEIDVPLSPAHHQAAVNAASNAGGKTVIDMVFSQQAHLSPEYLQQTLEAVKWAEVVVFSHPWVAPLIGDEFLTGKTVVYDSHNIEAALRAQLLDVSNPFEQNVLNQVVRAEQSAGDRADLILACSLDDADGFVTRYGWRRSQIRLVPNGVFSHVIQPATPEQKLAARVTLGIPTSAFVGFFIGSDYAPNVEAALFIAEYLARELPEVTFAIGGGVCSRMPSNLPANVRAVGFLEEQDKACWLHISDFAVNPMFSGSGTNIKMFDFMSAGLPVVTTPVGARGIVQDSSAGLRIADRGELVSVIRQLSLDRQAAHEGGRENRRMVEAKFAWENISPELGRTIRSVHLRKQGALLLKSPEAASHLRVAHLSTVGLKCGIGEYTRKIIDIYRQHGISNLLLTAQAANEEPDLVDLKVPSEIVWFFDNVEWTRSNIQPLALRSMLDWGATHLIVQYHPGFFSTEALFDFVAQTIKQDIVVTVVVHNFTDEMAFTMRRLNDLGVTMFSHRITEVIQARALGVFLDQIPMGIDESEFIKARTISHRDWKKQPPVLVTTGFLRKHKGVVTLIRAMPAVIKRFPGVHLIVQCALYPSEDSKLELVSCNGEVDRLNLRDSVTFDTRFLDKALVLAELAKGDLAVLPYEQSNEGGSATATDCMAVGLPLIVSNAEIFDEIREAVLTSQSDEDHLTDAIMKVLSNLDLYASLSKQSASYARENSWGSVAGAFLVASRMKSYGFK